MNTRRFATLLATAGLSLTLIGAGLGATFTDSATAGMTVEVGTFNIDITSAQGTVVGNTVTYTVPTIQSSAAGSAPFTFTVTSTGSIPAQIHVTATSPAAPFVDMLPLVADFTLNQGESHVFNAGLSWPELFNADLGMSTTVTYTISASA